LDKSIANNVHKYIIWAKLRDYEGLNMLRQLPNMTKNVIVALSRHEVPVRAMSSSLLTSTVRSRVKSQTSLVGAPQILFTQPRRNFVGGIGGNIGDAIIGIMMLGVAAAAVVSFGAYYAGKSKKASSIDYLGKVRCPHLKKVIANYDSNKRSALPMLLESNNIDLSKVDFINEAEAHEWLEKKIVEAVKAINDKFTTNDVKPAGLRK